MADEARYAGSPRDPLVGTRLGERYRIDRRLGEGGAGVVYDAVHEELDRPVAIKVLGAAWAYDPNAVSRFEREARAASKVGHRHIVDVYDLGRLDDGRPYLVMERLHGEPLDAVLVRRGRLEPTEVATLVTQAASALDAVHRRGIVHRDIKPENLFLVYHEGIEEPEVKLLDFGLAAISRPGSEQQRLTVQGMVHGTPHYMAPEATGDDLPDHRADVYSLGVVAYELLTGVVPIDSANPLQILTRKTVEDAPTLSEVSGEPWSEELEQVFVKALSRDPAMRQQSAGALARALASAAEFPRPTRPTPPSTVQRALATEGELQAGDSPSRAVRTMITRRPPRRGRGPRWAWVATVLLGAAVAGGTVAVLTRGSDGPPAPRDPSQQQNEASSGREPSLDLGGETRPPGPLPDDEPSEQNDEPVPAADAPGDEAAPPVDRRPARHRRRAPRRAAMTDEAGAGADATGGSGSDGEAAPAEGEPSEPAPRLAEESRARARALTRQGTAAMLQGRLPDAIRRFRDATVAFPGHAPAWRGLGLANERLGRAPEAARAYRRYLALAPGAPDAAEVRRRLDGLD